MSLTASPLNTEILEPARVPAAINAARRGFDFIVVDLHPSYGALNQAMFEAADRILVPVTPDVPAIRAAVQLSGVATELGIRDRLALVINRANSGVSVADMERTVGMPVARPAALRRAALRARRERGPDGHRDVPAGKDQRGLRRPRRPDHRAPRPPRPPKPAFGLFNRPKVAVRA